jgi:membrane-associated PAP2 superfamily phosphatase
MTNSDDLVSELVESAWGTSDGFLRIACPWDECDYASHAFMYYTAVESAEMVARRDACGTFGGHESRSFAWEDVR